MSGRAYGTFTSPESGVVTSSGRVGTSRKNPFTGVRWYELRNPGGTPTVFQQGTYAPDSSFRGMGSIGMDKAGNIAVGYSVSSSQMHPAIRYTCRLSNYPLRTLAAEASIFEGGGSPTRHLNPC